MDDEDEREIQRELAELEEIELPSQLDEEMEAAPEAPIAAIQYEEDKDYSILAHISGRGALSMGSDGLWSVGSDMSAKKWSMPNETPFLASIEQDSELMGIAVLRGKMCVALKNGEVRIIKEDDLTLESVLIRRPGPVWDVDFNPDGTQVCLGTSEHEVLVLDVQTSDVVNEFKGHSEPVITVAWDPKGEFVASASFDGSVKVWNVQSGTNVHTFDDVTAKDKNGDIDTNQVCRLQWSPDGEYLALPSKKTVLCTKRSSWNIDRKVDFEEETNAVAWSPNGAYIAVSLIGGGIQVWNVHRKQTIVLSNSLAGAEFQCLQWLPTGDILAAFAVDGDVVVFKNVLPRSSPSSFEQIADILEEEEDLIDVEEPVVSLKAGFADYGDSDEENERLDLNDNKMENYYDKSEVEMKIKGMILKRVPDYPLRQQAFQPSSTAIDADSSRRFLCWNNVGVIISRSEETYNSVEIEFSDKSNRSVRFTDHYGYSLGSLSPSGAIFATVGETAEEFDNQSEDMNMFAPSKDSEDWDPTKGADDYHPRNGKSVLQTAFEEVEKIEESDGVQQTLDEADPEKDYGKCSTIYFRQFQSWDDTNLDWTMYLPAKEKARCVAVGDTFCAVATSRRILRLFRHNGLQETPVMLPGPVISMSASHSLLFVIFHESEPCGNGTQNVGYMLVNLDSGDSQTIPGVISRGKVPCPVRETSPVKWIGLAEASMGLMPLFVDCKGMLMGLSQSIGWTWVPLMDFALMKKQAIWPVGLQGNMLTAVVLRGGLIQPETVPQPVVSSLKLQMPLLGVNAKSGALKHQFEQSALTDNLFLEQLKWIQPVIGEYQNCRDLFDEERLNQEEAKLDAELLKHFVLSIKLEKFGRAFGLVRKIRSDQFLEVALSQARKLDASNNLIDRIEQLIELRNSIDDEEESDEEEPTLVPNHSRKRLSVPPKSDDDEIYSVHDEEENRNDEIFMGSPPRKPAVNPFKKNPFAIGAKGTDLKPSVLTPKISRQSSFSQSARSNEAKKRKVT